MIRVLVVDDDFMVARVHRGFVERVDGFSVVGVAKTGAEALAAVDELRPDLVLLDIHLPDLSGIEVLQRLRGRDCDVDVLIVTADRDTEMVQRALRGGVVHYIVKPFDAATLRARLEQFAAVRAELGTTGAKAQDDIDRLLAARSAIPGVPQPRTPKGLSVQTAELVERLLRSADTDISASDCAGLTGLSRVSARRYLEHFVGAGHVVVTLQYGAAGRPERRYRWSAG